MYVWVFGIFERLFWSYQVILNMGNISPKQCCLWCLVKSWPQSGCVRVETFRCFVGSFHSRRPSPLPEPELHLWPQSAGNIYLCVHLPDSAGNRHSNSSRAEWSLVYPCVCLFLPESNTVAQKIFIKWMAEQINGRMNIINSRAVITTIIVDVLQVCIKSRDWVRLHIHHLT